MTQDDKRIVIDYIGGVSPKGLLEGTEITADRKEIQAFIDNIHTHLLWWIETSPERPLGDWEDD